MKSMASNPLFSTIITLHTLILLYFPTMLFSTLFLSASLLIISLLTLAATHKTHGEKPYSKESDPNPDPLYAESFVEWNVGAPLEVIHEEEIAVIEYPYSVTDSSSGGAIGKWDSTENFCFQWEEEEAREGLIEIELDGKGSFEAEEENLIEIDLNPANSPAR